MFIITGGGTGIGRALALSLAKRNRSVLIIGRRLTLLKETASLSSLITYLEADVSTEQGIERIRKHVENLPKIDALVNNAGTLEPIVSLNDIQPKTFHQALSTNLDAALFLPQKLQLQLNKGRVLNIGSGAAHFAIRGWAAYCISKAALAMLTLCWQLESQSIAFASVMPGIVDTEMQAIARNAKHMDPDQVQFYQKLKEDNRLISPETVAEFLAWLLIDVDRETYRSKEWDIYDTTHHPAWLKPPQQVLTWDY